MILDLNFGITCVKYELIVVGVSFITPYQADISVKEINLKEIQYAVCAHYQIGLTDLKSTRRDRKIARPRQLAMYLAKTLTPLSLPDIGRGFERDHTTVMHAVSTIENLISRDKSLSADADILIRRLKGENI